MSSSHINKYTESYDNGVPMFRTTAGARKAEEEVPTNPLEDQVIFSRRASYRSRLMLIVSP